MLCLKFSSFQLRFLLSRSGLPCSLLCDSTSFYGASASFGSPVPFATWSPFWTNQGCCGICLFWFSGLLNVVVPILYWSPFHSSDSFAFKFLLATRSPFGMSLASFDALSGSGFLFFPEVVPFSTRSGIIRPSSGSSLVSFCGCRHRSMRCLCLYRCFVSAFRLL